MKSEMEIGLRLALSKGYISDDGGNIFGPIGTRRKLFKIGKYLAFSVRADSSLKRRRAVSVFVHRFVAFRKYGECLFVKGIEVRHRNNISTDNTYDNLIIGTGSENQYDLPTIDRYIRAKHAASFIRKFTDKEEEQIVRFHREYRSYAKTMERFGIKKGTLHYVLHKKEYALMA